MNAIEDMGFESPTPIQEEVMHKAKAGRNVIGIAPTGTGKTLAFVLPTLMKLNYAQGDAPRALILAPTKELIMQIEADIEALSKYTTLRYVALYGGVGKQKQLEKVLAGVDIIVTTPRRFMEIYNHGAFRVKQINTFILDEADKMLDMGFLPQIRSVLDIIPMKKQNLLFSATFSSKVEALTQEFILDADKIEVAPQATTVSLIDQYRYRVPNLQTKINLLTHLLQDEEMSRVIVFVRTKKDASTIFRGLQGAVKGTLAVIHSNKEQNTRINAMRKFKAGEIRVMIATDVLSRGIDVELVTHVVNFDVPSKHEDYVHRVGRTGRAENEGVAYTFVNEAEVYHIRKIEKLIRQEVEELPIPLEVEVLATPKEEEINMLRVIDIQKKRDNPDYKGAFHEKQWKLRQTRKSKANSSKSGKWKVNNHSSSAKRKSSKNKRHK